MRRKAISGSKEYRKYDFLTEVDPERLKLIGAITLAWNWIEGALDASLCMATNIHASMWIDFASRINGIDGKIGLLKKGLVVEPKGILSDRDVATIKESIGQVEGVKRLRDGVIHARVIHPDAVVADTAQRKGIRDEVLLSEEALTVLYARLATISLEMDWVVQAVFFRQLLGSEMPDDARRQGEEMLRYSLAQLRDCQTTRAKIPPLPEFPDPPRADPSSEAAR
jgi:hypothetical protein